jgi:5,10-methylenetetrahydromethanopterin reductase
VGAIEAGIDRVWLADNPRDRPAIVTAGHLSAYAPGLQIGLGVVSTRERHPVILTQEVLALQAYCSRPLIVGLGVGEPSHTRLLGLPSGSGLAMLRRTADTIRSLSAGAKIPSFDADGKPFGLKFHGQVPPVYFAAIGPKTLQLSGAVADGVVLSLGTTVAAATTAVGHIRRGIRSTGTPRTVETVCYCAFGGTDAGALQRMQAFAIHVLREFFAQPGVEALLEGTGVDKRTADDLVAAHQRGIPVPDDLVDAIAIAGPVEHCVERIRAYQAAGIDEIALGMGGWNTSLDQTLSDMAELVSALSSAPDAP